MSVSKEHYSAVGKFLGDEVEIIFLKSKAKRSKLFKSKFGDTKLLRKWLQRYLQLKSKCSERFKRSLFSWFQILSEEVEIIFCESKAKRSKLFKSKFGHSNLLRKCFWIDLELKKRIWWAFGTVIFQFFFHNFGWGSWNHFLGKWGKAFKII